MPTQSILEFSFEEVIHILQIEISGGSPSLFIAALSIVVLIVFIVFFFRTKFQSKLRYLFLICYMVLGFVAAFNIDHLFKQFKYADSLFQFQTGNSKATYFIKSFEKSNSSDETYSDIVIANTIASFKKHRSEIDFRESKFPFLHKNVTKNVLGPFFPKSDEKPNIVLVVTESLSASFVGSKTTVGNLMPFTNSLINRSLYWPNIVSNAERSYAALPSLLASSPTGTGNRGFLHMETEKYPNQLSLIKLLKENNYVTNYFYGGWLYFDNVSKYLDQLEIDNMYGEDQLKEANYKKKAENSSTPYWGYSDKDVFRFSLEMLPDTNNRNPYFNIYQTLSIHSPFNLAPTKYYKKEFLQLRISNLEGINEEKLKKIPSDVLATIFYADDALEYLLNEYSKRSDFKNTIFIITGDHAINLNIDDSPFAHYRVPLIIYSPAMSNGQEFSSLHSHLDVLPTLNVLLAENFGVQVPELKPWIGLGLDTLSSFSSNTLTPLNLTSVEWPNFIVNNQVIWADEVYNIDSNLMLSPCDNEQDRNFAKNVFSEYIILNNYACSRNKIYPEN